MSAVAGTKPTGRMKECGECRNSIPISRTDCPHCGKPKLFPNVDLAREHVEVEKLEKRFSAACDSATTTGCDAIAQAFHDACSSSLAVFNCWVSKLFREIATGTDIFETYHALERLRLRTETPQDFDWQRLRPQAEIELLGTEDHLDQIHYACLSLDGSGLTSYGDCTVHLVTSMIAHRASCFEGNSAILYAKAHDFSNLIRSEWATRNRMCTAVCAGRIAATTTVADFPGILLEVGSRAEDDRFIEVHVFGPMTAKTFELVSIDGRTHTRRDAVLVKAIKDKFAKAGVQVEVRKS